MILMFNVHLVANVNNACFLYMYKSINLKATLIIYCLT